MAQIAKMESQVCIKSSAEMFFKNYCNKQKLFPKMCPNILQDMQFIKGDSVSVGSVLKWTFVPSGNSSPDGTCTVVVEATDEKNKSVTCRVIDGDFSKLYSHFKFTIQIMNSLDGNGSSVKSTLEYEKLNDKVSEPTMYFDLAATFYKSIDAYLINNP